MASLAVGAPTSNLTACYEVMKIYHNNIVGILQLCPEYTRKILDIECKDKKDTESYKDYLERSVGKPISNTKWKNLCRNYSETFATVTNVDTMDMTALSSLFQIVFTVKNDKRDSTQLLEKLKAIKNVRNNIMHDDSSMSDADAFKAMTDKMFELIEEAGKFYDFSPSESNAMEQELKLRISNINAVDCKMQSFNMGYVVTEGRRIAELRFKNFIQEELLFTSGHVYRPAVFYSPDVTQQGNDDSLLPYQNMFASSELFLLLTGVAGAGKTTLIKNIILQFTGLQSDVPKYLQRYKLLLYIECRDRTKKTLLTVVREHFGDVCTELGETNVLQILLALPMLILVDGFDERNKKSSIVLNELFQKIWHSDSSVLITTRPMAVDDLKQLIVGKNGTFSEYKIAPLSDLSSQLKFIDTYAESLVGDKASAKVIRKLFTKLDSQLRKLFSEPMMLLHFYDIASETPDKVSKWKNENDVAKDTFELYRTLLDSKLLETVVTNRAVLIDDLFMAIGKLALEFLNRDMITFTRSEFMGFERLCHDGTKTYGAEKEVDSGVVLSTMFRMNRPLSRSVKTTYSFKHKSLQEKFAAHYVARQMLEPNEPLDILIGSTATNASLQEVMQYVIQELSSSSPPKFRARWPELRDALTAAGVVSGIDWQNVLLRSPDVIELAKHAAKITIKETKEWSVHTVRDVSAVALLLPHEQPQLIYVRMRPAVLRSVSYSWSNLTRHHQHQLKLDLEPDGPMSHAPCDDVLECLRGSGCQLTELWSCICSASGVDAVASACTSKTQLHISVPGPLNLNALQGKYARLIVNIWPLDAAWAAVPQPSLLAPLQEEHRAVIGTKEVVAAGVRLPALPPPWLWVRGVKPGSCEAIVRAIRTIIPHTKRLDDISLPLCGLKKDEVRLLLEQLHSDGIRTSVDGQTRVTKNTHPLLNCDVVTLHITDDCANGTGTANGVSKVLAQLQSTNIGNSESQWTEVLDAMQEAGASARDWREALLCRPGETKFAFQAAETTKMEDKQFTITSSRDLDAVALMLPHAQDTTVMVKASLEALRAPGWQEVVRYHHGELRLRLPLMSPGFQPCDDLLESLLGSRSKITSFVGSIKSAAGVASLAAAATSARLRIRLEAPLDLSPLLGKYDALFIYTPVIGTTVAAVPLPNTPPPWLVVLRPPAGSWEAVAQTVLAYAPRSKRYSNIHLVRPALSENEERRLLALLHEEAIRTDDAGTTRGEPDGEGKRCLHICDDPPATSCP
ncbi:uncharacterized protein LOC108676923 [Hyalella azteca]|uniref:Uncharacterized protein LOC108676923 n=1 Tax=Hyalella azteca TaxID=294128 RepID=A0A8B7P3F5_HYAAZ|nr:uncharacterized protein LOC108676923 [Hyalella azteca]